MKKQILIVLLTLVTSTVIAQTYWQQEVNYKISVALDDQKHELQGNEEIEYINKSPYTLDVIYMHLWPNAYKNNHTMFARQKVRDGSNEFYFASDDQRGFIDQLNFQIDGEAVEIIEDEQYIDIIKIKLNKPLVSGDKILITTPFRVKLPHTFSRLGHVKQSYQITQWYPKPAVFDPRGWHPMPYLDQGEFYSEFGSFDVSITLPENYVVGATGILQNENEKAWLLDRTNLNVKENEVITSSSSTKTLRYIQDNIHDFAWFADKNYNVAKGEVVLPHSGRKVDTWYMYTSRFNKTREKGLKDLHDATYYYSKYVGDYPYTSVTAVTGALGAGGGMEYPMITVTQPSAIIHEVGHNWFYGILGSNERDNGWLDEGLNSFFENKTYQQQALQDTAKKEEKQKGSIQISLSDMHKISSEALETRNINQPVHYTSNSYHSANYFVQLYQKPVLLMRYLEDYLGEEVFVKCFHQYYKTWSFKHPHIEDMQKIFEDVSGKNLDWLFRSIIKNNVAPTVRISKVLKNKRGFDASFYSQNKMPIKANLLNEDKEVISSKWVEFKSNKTNVYFNTKAKKIAIDDENMVFSSNSDKFVRKNGPLKRLRLPQINLFFPREKVNRSGVGVLPAVGVNSTDGFLSGVMLYNNSIRSKKLNYTLVPMYGVKSQALRGLATMDYYYYPYRDFYVVNVGGVAQHFANYERYAFTLAHWSKVEMFDISWNNKIKIKSSYVTSSDSISHVFTDLQYQLYHKDAVREFKFYPTLGFNTSNFNESAIKTTLEMFGSYKYARKDNIGLRVFAGAMSQLGVGEKYYFGLSNGLDYAREYYHFDRVGNHPNQGFSNGQDGGFRGYENTIADWMVTSNLTVDIPKLPFSAYYDAGYLSGDIFKWGAGITLEIKEDLIEFYFPIAGTNYINTLPTDASEFGKSIRIMLKFPLKSANEIAWDKI